MAEESWPKHVANDNFEMIAYRASKRKAYIDGANAVISEIERIINENEDGCLALERIQLRLSELKER